MAIPRDIQGASPARDAATKLLRKECLKVKTAAKGARNETLNKAAFTCGGLVAARLLERVEVEVDLLAAILDNGGNEDKDTVKIAEAIDAGMQKPWTPTTGNATTTGKAGKARAGKSCGGEKRVEPPCVGQAALRRYRWCRPQTRGTATTVPSSLGSTSRLTGASASRLMCGRSLL
jgi:hypothetical protein